MALTATSPAYRRSGLNVPREEIGKVFETVCVTICPKEASPMILKMPYSNARGLKPSPRAKRFVE